MKNFCQNRACKMGVWAGKIVITALLVFFMYERWQSKTGGDISDFDKNIILITITFLVVLPTIFVFFFKNRIVARHPKFAAFWKFGRFIYGFFIALFIILVVWGLWQVYDKDKTEKAVFRINSVRITLTDVMGENLPPKPDQTLNDSTVEGIDANDNFIRDDVELAIFEKYPDSAKIRAAMLQYAQALQMELTMVFNSETLVATIQKEDLAYECLDNASVEKDFSTINKYEKEIENIVLNTDLRNKIQLDNSKKYMTTYSLPPGGQCDVDLKDLPN